MVYEGQSEGRWLENRICLQQKILFCCLASACGVPSEGISPPAPLAVPMVQPYTQQSAATSTSTPFIQYLLSWVLFWMQIINLYVTKMILHLIKLMFPDQEVNVSALSPP